MTSANATQAGNGRHDEWVPVLDVAAREVFELMMGCKLTLPEGPITDNLNITSMVGLAGKLCGVMTVRCDGRSAALMASKMLGVEVDQVGNDLSDALGEVCNMVAGNFKSKISGLAEGCMLSPPTVITGSDYCMQSMTDSPAVELNVLFENMPVVISLQVHN
jgi:chemotaxis protein CheX